MFTITGDTLAGIVVGFVLGVLTHQAYVKYAYEVVEDEKPTTEIPTEPPKKCEGIAGQFHENGRTKRRTKNLWQVMPELLISNERQMVAEMPTLKYSSRAVFVLREAAFCCRREVRAVC